MLRSFLTLSNEDKGGRWFENDLSAYDKEYSYIKTMAKKI